MTFVFVEKLKVGLVSLCHLGDIKRIPSTIERRPKNQPSRQHEILPARKNITPHNLSRNPPTWQQVPSTTATSNPLHMKTGKDWDEGEDLLSAMKETPQEALCYSLFQLLYD